MLAYLFVVLYITLQIYTNSIKFMLFYNFFIAFLILSFHFRWIIMAITRILMTK